MNESGFCFMLMFLEFFSFTVILRYKWKHSTCILEPGLGLLLQEEKHLWSCLPVGKAQRNTKENNGFSQNSYKIFYLSEAFFSKALLLSVAVHRMRRPSDKMAFPWVFN